jgi:all-trans-8'-apo-beta-carotenal 15,15'-oxygenase
MNRRHFLSSSLALAAGSSLVPAWAQAVDPYYVGFREGLKKQPALGAFANVSSDVACSTARIEGKIPVALRGVLYRNGPAQFERGGVRHHHWFEGDGMVQAYRFTDEGVSHMGKFVRTKKFKAEEKAGRLGYSVFGGRVKDPMPVTGPDSMNAANTSVIAINNAVYALWEGGSAYEVDPVTLTTKGPKVWAPDWAGMPFSAHPKVTPDGNVWNIGGGWNGDVAVYHINPQGQLVNAKLVKVPPTAMLHDFLITENFVVLVLSSASFDSKAMANGEGMAAAMKVDLVTPMRVVTLAKNNLSDRKEYDLPNGFVFHFGNAFETRTGQIMFDYVRFDSASIMADNMKAIMKGDTTTDFRIGSRSQAMLVTLDPKTGKANQTAVFNRMVEMPNVDPRVVGKRHQYVFHTSAKETELSERALGFAGISRVDIHSGRTDAYDYGSDYVVEEHILVPKLGSAREGEGWLVGAAYNAKTQMTELAVFEALALAAGPVAKVFLPYGLPIGFHGHFYA